MSKKSCYEEVVEKIPSKESAMLSMRKNILVILVGSSVLALSILWAQDAKFAADSSQHSRSFTEALAEAKRLGETEEGKAYDEEFGKVAGPRLSDAVSECTKNRGPRVNFEVVFVFAADGRVEQVLTPSDKPAAKCFGDKLRDLQLPAPPHPGWPLLFTVNISPDNAPRILALNLKLMEAGTWEVDATINRAFTFHVHGLLNGDDFDLTVEPEDRNAVRQIAIKDQVWASFDGSKTWKLESGSEQTPFRRIYAFVHNPLRTEAKLPTLEVVKQENRDGETWMRLRPKTSDKKKGKLQQVDYWIAISQDPKRNGVRRYEGSVTEPGHENEPLHCVATYQPANNKRIEPPASAAALSEQESAQSATPDAKFAADNLKYSRDFYSKVHFVAIANLDFGAGGRAEFKYDRYPNGGPERIQAGNGEEFARKDGKTWLKSNDWGETGKPVDAQTAKRLNNWVGLIDSRLNGEPASKDPSEGATVMKFLGKETDKEREEFVFEESKEKPKAKSYPHISFGRFKNAPDQQVLLSEFSGPMRLGAREAMVKISFSHLIAVQIKNETNAAESPPPAAANGSSPDTSGQSAAAGQAASSAAPASDESDGDLVNRGIEKAKNGDLDGAMADFDRAIKLNPKDDAPYYNRAQAKWLKKDAAGAIADYTRAIELGSTNPAAYNNRGNARAGNNDRDGAIADYTRAIELKPDYARAYYNRAMAKEANGDKAGAEADFKTAAKLDPELASEQSAADSKDNNPSGVTTVSLLDGKLKIDLPADFSRDPDDPKDPKTLAKFSGPDGAWGEVLRGTHGLTPDKLDSYLKMRVAEYNKGFKWLPKDSHLQWLKKDIVTIGGRKWADWSFVPMLKGKKDYSHNPVYTRFLTTSYKGQLLEINFTSNLNTSPELKKEIDHIMDSVHLEE
jgi:tetratricopeptide (TPR) repeat protein